MKNSRHGRPKALAEIKFAEKADWLKNKSHKEIFNFINQTNLWGAEVSRSGLGSELEATAHIRAEIPKLFSDLKIESVLDLPCGDFAWMKKVKLPIKKYIGADIVDSIVDKLESRFAGLRDGVNYSFVALDVTKDQLPPVDLIICRDCLVHFSYSFISQAIQNMKRSGAKYLLTTTFTDLTNNIDIQDGDWRPLNLEVEPFVFGKPQTVINEHCTEVDGAFADKSLALWNIDRLPKFP